jgi:hypothetical protein
MRRPLARQPAAWRRLVSLALCLDLVFWFEAVAITLLLAANPPGDLESLRHLRLHAGLDLFWHPDVHWLASGLEAANAFTVWWSVLLGLGLHRFSGFRQRAPARSRCSPGWVSSWCAPRWRPLIRTRVRAALAPPDPRCSPAGARSCGSTPSSAFSRWPTCWDAPRCCSLTLSPRLDPH